ncbi:MAG: SDR family oxidoreductase [Lachnospiraceae bacterium]|nr:SDR family oxidoreductase [Lachnospiraceae bacterium]
MRKTALITGASCGLGYEFSKIFASEGYHLVLVARSEGKLYIMKEKLEKAYGINVYVCAQDLSKQDAAMRVWEFVQEKQIAVDVLINDAGFGDFGKFANSNWEKQYDMLQVNITALTQLTHLFMKPMIERRQGKILNLASIAAFMPGPMMSVYYATKAYVLSFTEALSVELRGTGVSVTALCPGPTNTGFAKNAELGKSRLFKAFENTTARSIAEYGYETLMTKQVVAVPSRKNKLTLLAVRLLPRRLVRRFVYLVQK